MQAVAAKNIQAWSGRLLIAGPGPWLNAPRYSPKPATSSRMAKTNTLRTPGQATAG